MANETSDNIAAAERLIKAALIRIAEENDPDALTPLVETLQRIDLELWFTVKRIHDSGQYSYSNLAECVKQNSPQALRQTLIRKLS